VRRRAVITTSDCVASRVSVSKLLSISGCSVTSAGDDEPGVGDSRRLDSCCDCRLMTMTASGIYPPRTTLIHCREREEHITSSYSLSHNKVFSFLGNRICFLSRDLPKT
jgi:hypothetical protein